MAHTIPMELSSSMAHTHNIPGKKAKSCSIKNRSIAAPETNIVVPGEKELKSQVFGIIPGFIIIYFGFLIKEKTDSYVQIRRSDWLRQYQSYIISILSFQTASRCVAPQRPRGAPPPLVRPPSTPLVRPPSTPWVRPPSIRPLYHGLQLRLVENS